MTVATERLIDAANRFFDALERGDADAAIEVAEQVIHPEIEHTSAIGSELQGRAYRGLDEFRGWFTELAQTFELRFEDREFRAPREDLLVCLSINRMRGRGSGAEIKREIGVVWESEDGLVRRSASYGTHAEAIAAAEALVER